jgi:hypothetical protein
MAETAPQDGQTPGQPFPRIGRDEMNLSEFPIALLADRVPKGQKTLYFEDEHGRLTVTGSDAYGLPNATDADVIVVLIYLTKLRNDFRDAKVHFSRYELVNLLSWPDEGWSYKRLDESLNRWGGVWLVYDKCWWNNHLKCYTSAKMHIIENVEIIDNDTRRKAHFSGQPDLPFSSFTWDRKFIESCQADNLRHLNLDEYFSLKSAVSKRLYRFLGKRFYRQDEWTFDLNEIAFERVGLSRNYADAYKIKEKLQPALEELEALGFLRPLSRADRYQRVDRGRWTIRLARHSPTLVAPQHPGVPAAQAAPPQPALPLTEPEPPLIAALVRRGVTRATAVDLARRHPAERIEAKIDVFDWLRERQDRRVGKSPAGYLVKSIETDYAAPAGYVSKAERQQREEARQAKEREAAEQQRRQQEADAQEKAKRQEADAYWATLTPEQQAELDAEILAHASEDERQTYDMLKRIRGGEGYLTMLRIEYIHALRQRQTELA